MRTVVVSRCALDRRELGFAQNVGLNGLFNSTFDSSCERSELFFGASHDVTSSVNSPFEDGSDNNQMVTVETMHSVAESIKLGHEPVNTVGAGWDVCFLT